MKICIDGLGISRLHGTGLYSYTYELLDNLFKIYPQPQYSILWDDHRRIDGWNKSNNLYYENLNLYRKQNDYSLLEEYLVKNKVQLYHSPNNGFSLPSRKVSKYIMTVHDVLPMSHGGYADLKYMEKFKAVFPDAVKICDRISAVSAFVKGELQYYFKIPENKIEVIYPGCSSRFCPIELEKCRSLIKDKYNINDNFILYSGSIHERKNLPLLLSSFKNVLKQSDGLKLVIAGKANGKREEYYLKLKNLAEQLGVTSSIIFTGIVDYEDMPYLYNASKCAVNLSMYEGFPMSTVEAMACGIPVICMRSPSFEEIAGNGASYVDAGNEDGVKDIILKVIYNKAYREDMIQKGKLQAMKFNPETSAKKMVSIYESTVYGS